jgi:hypothetical protein
MSSRSNGKDWRWFLLDGGRIKTLAAMPAGMLPGCVLARPRHKKKSPVTIAGNRAFARLINRAGRVPGGRRGTYTEEETLALVDLTESGGIDAERPKMAGLGLPT